MHPLLAESTFLQRLRLPESSRLAWLFESSQLSYSDAHDLPAWRGFVDASVSLADRHLPGWMAAALGRFYSGSGPDVLVLENLPVDRVLPAAPRDGKRPFTKSCVSEAVIAGLIERHAAILAYSNEKGGSPIHEIAPVTGLEHATSSAGRAPFAFHTDVAFLAPRFSPRGLLLFGLLNQANAPTAVLPLERILEAAPPPLLRSLEKPIFRHPAPASFELPVSTLGPILWRDRKGRARIAVQTHAVQPTNEDAQGAIVQLRTLLESMEPERIVLRAGDALLFRNDRVLHGRDAFTGERWLQRAYFTGSLFPFQECAGAGPSTLVFDAQRLLKDPALQKVLAPPEPISHSKN